jgi:chromosome segregation ATPase
MSQLARMFVIVNFLLAAGFLYAAAMFLGLNEEWKTKHEQTTATLTKERQDSERKLKENTTRIDELTRESQTLKEQNSTLGGNLSQLQKANTDATNQIKEKDSTIAKEQGNVQSTNDNLKAAQAELSKRTDEANQLRTAAQEAQTNERKANDELTKAKDEIRNRDNTIAELEKTKTDLTTKVENLELVAEGARRAGFNIADIVAPAPIADAKVIAVDADMKLVQVNAGSTQKVARGGFLDIVRGDRYIGRIKIDQVYPNSAAGTISVLKPGESVQVGDRATNTLN